jgi:hypothetical protein
MLRLAFLLLAWGLLCGFGAHAQSSFQAAPWQDILVLDCAHGLHLLPSHPLLSTSLDASLAASVYTSVVNTIRSRVSCYCPSLTTAEIAQSFTVDFGAFLAAVETGTDNSTSRTRCGLVASMDEVGLAFDQALPSTCTAARWANGEPCELELAVPGFDCSSALPP